MRKYKFKKPPYHHQVEAIKFLLKHEFEDGKRGGALLMDPRTGKTKVVVDTIAIAHQYEGVNRVIMVGPKVAIQVWKEQLYENMQFRYRLTIWDRKGRKEYALPPYGQDILDIVLINYDAFSTPGAFRVHRSGPLKGQYIEEGGVEIDGKLVGTTRKRGRTGGRYDIIKKVKLWQPQMIVLDESHRIKSPSAKKSTAMHTLSRVPDWRIIMTGTVTTKARRLFDVYSQWQFLNPRRFGNMTFGEFKSRYGRWKPMGNYEKWLRNDNEEELHDLIHLDAYSITREECYDLPESTPQRIYVDLEESAEAYQQMAEDMVARIHTGEITEASIRLVQRLRLQQITSGFTKTSPTMEYPQGRIVELGSEKLRMIQSRLEDLMEADEKVVIGALFKHDIARLEHLAKNVLKVPTFVIQGATKQRDRDAAPKAFSRVKGGAIFIGQPAAAGEAIDLSAASILQWYSLPSSWVNFKQFSDRIALSSKPTFHEFYLVPGSVDEMMYETLLEDSDIGKKMIQSPQRLLQLGQQMIHEEPKAGGRNIGMPQGTRLSQV